MQAGVSLTEDILALIEDGKTYLEAEKAFQKSRAGFVANKGKHGIIRGLAAFGMIHLALIGLVVGVVMALSLSKYGESQEERCFVALDDADVDACATTVSEAGADIWGIAFNTGLPTIGDLDPKDIMKRGLAAAEACGRPILYGARWEEDWPLAQQLELLRAGDVVTYCLNSFTENLVADGQVVPAVWQARERGVLFDAGHGMRSFSFPVAEAMIAEGFLRQGAILNRSYGARFACRKRSRARVASRSARMIGSNSDTSTPGCDL